MIEANIKGILVCPAQDSLFVRVVGRGTFQNSRPLRSYLQEALNQGIVRFVIDLGACQGMDSTFLGVLAGLGLRLRQMKGGGVQIVNAAPRNLDLLQTLGLDRLLEVSSTAAPAGPGQPMPPANAFQLLSESDVEALTRPLDRDETADLMLEAHENLQKADGRNAQKFQDLTQMLRAGVQRRQEKAKGQP